MPAPLRRLPGSSPQRKTTVAGTARSRPVAPLAGAGLFALADARLQGRVSAAATPAIFGARAPMQALGSLAIRYATFRQLDAGGAVAALACEAYLARRAGGHRAAPDSSSGPCPAVTGTDGPQ